MRGMVHSVAFALILSAVPVAARADDDKHDEYVQQVLEATNAERAKMELPALKLSDTLSKAAQGHSETMASKKKVAHDFGTDSPTARMKAAGYKHGYWSENVAGGQADGTSAVAAWMTSQGHKENILGANIKEIGIGVAFDDKGKAYWCQKFANPRE